MTGIEEAIYAAGSQTKLAKMLGCTQQNVGFWLRQGYCPAERIIEVEQATGISRMRLINPKLVDLLTPASI